MDLLKNSSIGCTKRRLFLLLILNFSDWICTLALLSTGCFSEANPLMQSVVESVPLGFAVKVVLPFSLTLLALHKIRDASSKQVIIANRIILFGVTVYFLINLYHIFCFSVFFIFLRG